MHSRKTHPKKMNAIPPRRLSGRLQRSMRSAKIPADVHMRSPSPRLPHDLPSGPDNDQTLINRNDDDSDEWFDEAPATDDNAYFHWEEETALYSDLLEEATSETGDAELVTLAESLQKPFDEESRQLKKEIAEAFVPLVNKIKGVYASIDHTVDIPFGAGLLCFNDACKEMEVSIGSNAEVLQKIQAEHRTRITELLGQLEREYAHREQLWVGFQKAMDELVNPVLEMLNEAPAKLERKIASIEKQSRALEKESASATADATAQTLKDLLSKLG